MASSDRNQFLDVRAHGFARVAVCVPEVRVADPQFNARAHVAQLQTAYTAGAHYAVCPELGLSSYTCGDLFAQESLLRGVEVALQQVADATAAWDMVFSVGAPLRLNDLLFICAVTLHRGRPLAVTAKTMLANYREYYEARWFQPGDATTATTISVLGHEVPFGNDVLIRVGAVKDFTLHVEICEDLWVPVPPSSLAALAGATIIANLSASNITIAKWEYRRDLVRGAAARNLAVQLYSAAGFGESTSDLAWDGQGLIADRGELVGETERFALHGSTVVVDVDLHAVKQDRMRQTSFGANAMRHPRPMRVIEVEAGADQRAASVYNTLRRNIGPHPFVPSDPAARDERCREVFMIQASSLARRLLALPPEGRRIVIGVSGGQDSTHALLVAAHAMDLLGIERSCIIGITMPGLGTTARTRANALALIKALHATSRELSIVGLSESVFAAIEHPPSVEDLTFENVQAWLRKVLLLAIASQRHGIDVGTGDLSEIALGWCTYGGDHLSHYGVNAGVPKTLISYLIAWAAEVVFHDETRVRDILHDVLATPISPELRRPGSDGAITQRSEEVVGPYELHDFFLYHFLRFGTGPQRIARLALHAFAGRYDIGTIRRWLLVFLQRFFANQFKRNCLPDGPKVGSGGALSPRGDWRMPADASADVWLADAASVPEVIHGA